MSVKKFGIGQPMRRVEDHRLLTGGGRYTDDYSPDKTLHAVVLRSPHAHAKFTFTDLDTARAMKGVKLVLTAAEVAHLGDVPCQGCLPNADGTQSHVAHIPVLAKGVAKHVGDAVAFVVAETPAARPRCGRGHRHRLLDAARARRHAPGRHQGRDRRVVRSSPTTVAYDIAMGDKAKVDAHLRQGRQGGEDRDREQPPHHQLHGDARRASREYDAKTEAASSSRSPARASTACATRWPRTS